MFVCRWGCESVESKEARGDRETECVLQYEV